METSDPSASSVEWTPVSRGGANFRTHKLVETEPGRMEFRASAAAKIFGLIFLCSGLMFTILFPIVLRSAGKLGMNQDTLVPFAAGSAFTALGGFMFYLFTRPAVFDKRNGYFWKGWKPPEKLPDPETLKDYTRLDRIRAIQILSEYCSAGRKSYYSYELNLVLENGSRINVTDHGDADRIRQDARTLAEFLGRPVWDRSS